MSISQFRDRVAGRDISEDTADVYVRWVKRFQAWNDGSAITEGLLRDFDSALENPTEIPLADRTEPYSYSERVKALSAIKKWAEVMYGADIRPDVNDLIRGGPDDFNPTVYSREAVQSVLDDPCDLEGCFAARAAGYDLIMRASEVTDMRAEDIDAAAGTVYVRAKKGSENRTLSVTDRTMQLLEEQRDRVQRRFDRPKYLFYNSYGNRLTAGAFSKHMSRHHGVGTHAVFRHSAIVHAIEDQGFGAAYIRARHHSPSMTSRYASVVDIDPPEWAQARR